MPPIPLLSDSDLEYGALEAYFNSDPFGQMPDAWIMQALHEKEGLEKLSLTLQERFSESNPGDSFPGLPTLPISLPTKYDSPFHYMILQRLVTEIKDAAATIGIDCSNFPHFACIPTRSINARVFELPTGRKPFIIFDAQLLSFCHLFSKGFALCLPLEDYPDKIQFNLNLPTIKDYLKKSPEGIERLKDVISVYVSGGIPTDAKQYFLPPNYDQLASILLDSMELFIVAHEFGHAYSGHLRQLLPSGIRPDHKFSPKDKDHIKEIEADLLGLVLTITALNKRGLDIGLSTAGINLFFIALGMIDCFDRRASHFGSWSTFPASKSHPSNFTRRKFILEHLDHIGAHPDSVMATKSLTKTMDQIAALSWQAINTRLPNWKRRHQ
jgi:hypothetical protein